MGAMAALLGLGTSVALGYAGQKHREKEQDEQFNKDLRKQLLLNHVERNPQVWSSIAFQGQFKKEFGDETFNTLKPSLDISLAHWARNAQTAAQTRAQMSAGMGLPAPGEPGPASPLMNVNGGSAPPAAAPGPASGSPAATTQAAFPAPAPGPTGAPPSAAPAGDPIEGQIAHLEGLIRGYAAPDSDGNPIFSKEEAAPNIKLLTDKIAALRKQQDKATTEANRREDAATRERERREDAATARGEHRADRATTMAAAEVARKATREAAQEARIGTMENTLVTKNNMPPGVASGIARALVTGTTLSPSQERAYAKAMPMAADYEKNTFKPLPAQLAKAATPEEKQGLLQTNNDKVYDVAESMGLDQGWIDDHFMVEVPTDQLKSAGPLTKFAAKIGVGKTTVVPAAVLKQSGWDRDATGNWQPPGSTPATTSAMR